MVGAARPRVAMWTYPWDVQDLSADRVTADLRGVGVETISLAAAYHAGRFLQARSRRRRTFYPEDGTIYFRPTPARWSEHAIRPQVAALVAEDDILADLVRRRDAGVLGVSCWTVCLHNTRLGLRHPEAVTRNCFDEPNRFNLCPSHPDVRAYAVTLVEDLAATYQPDAIELETVGFMGWAHGEHHEKDGVGLLPEDDLLLSLCFCPACLAGAAKVGIHGRRVQATVRALVEAALERPLPEPRWPDVPARGPDAFATQPELRDFLRWRCEPVASLVTEIRDRAAAATKVYVIDGPDGWTSGSNLPSVAAACDGVVLCVYDRMPEEVAAVVGHARAAVGPERFLGVGFRLFHPEMRGAADVAARLAAARGAGCDGFNLYNYGLVPGARLDWLRDALT